MSYRVFAQGRPRRIIRLQYKSGHFQSWKESANICEGYRSNYSHFKFRYGGGVQSESDGRSIKSAEWEHVEKGVPPPPSPGRNLSELL